MKIKCRIGSGYTSIICIIDTCKCSQHTDHSKIAVDYKDSYPVCGRPTKWKTPKEIKGKTRYLCGIHANEINRMLMRLGKTARCLPMTKKELQA